MCRQLFREKVAEAPPDLAGLNAGAAPVTPAARTTAAGGTTALTATGGERAA